MRPFVAQDQVLVQENILIILKTNLDKSLPGSAYPEFIHPICCPSGEVKLFNQRFGNLTSWQSNDLAECVDNLCFLHLPWAKLHDRASVRNSLQLFRLDERTIEVKNNCFDHWDCSRTLMIIAKDPPTQAFAVLDFTCVLSSQSVHQCLNAHLDVFRKMELDYLPTRFVQSLLVAKRLCLNKRAECD